MLGLFASQEQKMRENAGNWIELADRVWCYRRDTFSDAEAQEFQTSCSQLRQSLRENADSGKLKLGIESLEEILRRVGGAIYPKTSLTEIVEFFLVFAMIILGCRAYFIQPFKIPTNSMWPTYSGMTGQALPTKGPGPGFLENAILGLFCGASPTEMLAPANGAVEIPFEARTGRIAYTIRMDRAWHLFPVQVKDYSFYVDGIRTTVTVPADFEDFDRIAIHTFYPNVRDDDIRSFAAQLERSAPKTLEEPRMQRFELEGDNFHEITMVTVPGSVKKGDAIIRFELLTGDQLIVDRFSYNFVRPTVGQGFVFRTDNIPGIGKEDFYVKRLIGSPGDKVEIRAPMIYRNGKPIDWLQSVSTERRSGGTLPRLF